MKQRFNYVKILNNFWFGSREEDRKKLSIPASVMYFYLLHLMNKNYWKPVVISDRELARLQHISDSHIYKHKRQLVQHGFIKIEIVKDKFGLNTTQYDLPEDCDK